MPRRRGDDYGVSITLAKVITGIKFNEGVEVARVGTEAPPPVRSTLAMMINDNFTSTSLNNAQTTKSSWRGRGQ